MKLIIQRVNSASLTCNDENYNTSISKGYLVYIGISNNCSDKKVVWCVDKLLSQRLFENEDNKGFQKSIEDIQGEILVVSQFTLFADCTEGTKPKFNYAGDYLEAKGWYDEFISLLKQKTNCSVKTGKFGDYMNVESENTGPVTIILEQ